MKKIFLTTALLIVTLIVGGCSRLGRNVITGAQQEFVPDATVYTYCGPVCAAKGQCGTTEQAGNLASVVLLNPEQPATRNHGAVLQDNQPVVVIERRPMEIVYVLNQSQVNQHPFYRVRNDARGLTGWIDGVCLANRQQ